MRPDISSTGPHPGPEMSEPPRTALVDWHLPDPERAPEFYADVPLKRLLAFVIDSAVIFALSLFAVVLTAFIGLFFCC